MSIPSMARKHLVRVTETSPVVGDELGVERTYTTKRQYDPGMAAAFESASSQYLAASDTDRCAGALWFSCWVRIDVVTPGAFIAGKASADEGEFDGQEYYFDLNASGQFRYNVRGQAGIIRSTKTVSHTQAITVGRWYFLLGKSFGQNISLYVASEVASGSWVASGSTVEWFGPVVDENPFCIGGLAGALVDDGTVRFLDGCVDNVVVGDDENQYTSDAAAIASLWANGQPMNYADAEQTGISLSGGEPAAQEWFNLEEASGNRTGEAGTVLTAVNAPEDCDGIAGFADVELRCTVVPGWPRSPRIRDMLEQKGIEFPHTIYFIEDPLLEEENNRLVWLNVGRNTELRLLHISVDTHGARRLFVIYADSWSIDQPTREFK